MKIEKNRVTVQNLITLKVMSFEPTDLVGMKGKQCKKNFTFFPLFRFTCLFLFVFLIISINTIIIIINNPNTKNDNNIKNDVQ